MTEIDELVAFYEARAHRVDPALESGCPTCELCRNARTARLLRELKTVAERAMTASANGYAWGGANRRLDESLSALFRLLLATPS